VLDKGEVGMKVEGAGAEVSSLEDRARSGNCAIIRVADEGGVNILGRLKRE